MTRRGTVLLLAVMFAALTSGCASGFDATARQAYPPGDGVQAGSGDLRIVSALVAVPEDATTGVVLMAVVNNGGEPAEITSVDSDSGTVDYTGSREVPAGETVVFSAESDPSVSIRDLTVKPGEEITVKVSFADAEPITLNTLVVPATGTYSSVTLPPEPTPTPTPSETASATTSDTPSDATVSPSST